MSSNRVIGKDGKIPWNIQTDLEYFKNTTLGHCVIYGRKTFESLPKKTLPNRLNVVVSKTLQETSGINIFKNVSDAINFCKKQTTRPYEIFICGGEKLYIDTMSLVQRIYLTYIKKSYEGDRVYPEIKSDFKLVWENSFSKECSFRVYEKTNG